MAGFPPTIAHDADSPAVSRFASDLHAYGRDFARMSPAQQLVTTRYLNATDHDLIRVAGDDPRLAASRRFIGAAARLEESGDAKDAGRLLDKADRAWTAVAADMRANVPAAVPRATTPRMPLVGVPDPRETAMQQRLAASVAMPHESPATRARADRQTA